MADIPEVKARNIISLLDEAAYLVSKTPKDPETLLEEICKVRGVPIELVKTKDRSFPTFKIRVTFFGICREHYPNMELEQIAKIIKRSRCLLYKYYPNALENDSLIRDYYLNTKELLLISSKESTSN